MKKIKLFIAVILICVAGNLSALDGLFFGVGPEVSAYTREGVAVGGSLVAGLELNPQFATGLKLDYFYDLDTVNAMDAQAFFRYSLPLMGLFLQAEAGLVAFFEHGETFPSFSAGLSAGWRYKLSQDLFIEPAVRFGYPNIWAVGILAGYKFSLGKD